jgi:hypothetical protein
MHAAEAKSRYHEPCRHLDAVHVVAHEDGAQLLEHQNEPVGHEHLLQVVALVKVAEEGPFEHVAEDGRQHHAGHQHQQKLVPEQRCERERHVRADHVKAAMGEVDHAHDPEDQREPRGHQEEQESVLNRVQALDEKGAEIHVEIIPGWAGRSRRRAPATVRGTPRNRLCRAAGVAPLRGESSYTK